MVHCTLWPPAVNIRKCSVDENLTINFWCQEICPHKGRTKWLWYEDNQLEPVRKTFVTTPTLLLILIATSSSSLLLLPQFRKTWYHGMGGALWWGTAVQCSEVFLEIMKEGNALQRKGARAGWWALLVAVSEVLFPPPNFDGERELAVAREGGGWPLSHYWKWKCRQRNGPPKIHLAWEGRVCTAGGSVPKRFDGDSWPRGGWSLLVARSEVVPQIQNNGGGWWKGKEDKHSWWETTCEEKAREGQEEEEMAMVSGRCLKNFLLCWWVQWVFQKRYFFLHKESSIAIPEVLSIIDVHCWWWTLTRIK